MINIPACCIMRNDTVRRHRNDTNCYCIRNSCLFLTCLNHRISQACFGVFFVVFLTRSSRVVRLGKK